MRRSKGTVYRPTVTRTVKGKKRRKPSRFYWAEYVDHTGARQRHVLKLPNGQKVTDKTVAVALLEEILKRDERRAVGLIDPYVESASLSMRVVVARYVRHLRGSKRAGRRYTRQTLSFAKFVIEQADIKRLADFTEDRIDRALSMLAESGSGKSRQTSGKGASPKTVNEYRTVC